MFNLFKKNKSENTKKSIYQKAPINRDRLTNFQKSELVFFADKVEQLELLSKLQILHNSLINSFINELLFNVKKLKNFEEEQPKWFYNLDKIFYTIDETDKKQIIELTIPVYLIAKDQLNKITNNYSKLINDVKEHKRLSKIYDEYAARGGHISQDREFIGIWINTIGEQWFRIAHFVYEIEVQKRLLNM